MNYEYCKIIITALDGSDDIVNNAGFTVKAIYNDGFGRCMYKDRDYEVHDRKTVVRLDELGIDPDFQPSEEDDIECIVTSGEMKESHLPTLEYEVKSSIYEYKTIVTRKRVAESKILPVAFWNDIYNDVSLKRGRFEKLVSLSIKDEHPKLLIYLKVKTKG